MFVFFYNSCSCSDVLSLLIRRNALLRTYLLTCLLDCLLASLLIINSTYKEMLFNVDWKFLQKYIQKISQILSGDIS